MTTVSATRIALIGGGLIAVTYGLARFVFGLFLPAIRADLALGPSMAGAIGALPFASYVAAILAAPWLSRALGVRWASLAVGALALCGLLAIAGAGGPALLALGVLVCGVSTGLSSPILAEAVQRLVHAARRGRVNAAINAATSVGIAASAPAALWWTDAWRQAYVGFAGLALLALLAVAVGLPRPAAAGRRDDRSVAAEGRRGDGSTAGRRRDERAAAPAAAPVDRRAWADLVRLGVLAGVMGFVSSAYWVFAPDFAATAGGLAPAQTAWMWLALGLGGLAGTWAGDLVDRHGPGISHAFALAALSAALTLLAADPGNLALALASAAAFGAAYMTLTGLYLVASVRILPQRPALGPVIPFLAVAGGQVAGSPLAGAIIGADGYGTAFGGFAALGLGAAVLSLHLPALGPEAAQATGGE